MAQKNIGTREVPAEPAAAVAAGPKSKDKPVTAAKPALPKSSDKPGLAAAKPVDKPVVRKAAVEQPAKFQKKIVDKPSAVAAAAMTKPVRLAKNDPLAPLQPKHSGHSKEPLADR
jgi:hypothetical protein